MKKLLFTTALFLIPISSFAFSMTPLTGHLTEDYNQFFTCNNSSNVWIAYNNEQQITNYYDYCATPYEGNLLDNALGIGTENYTGTVYFVELQDYFYPADWGEQIPDITLTMPTYSDALATSSLVSTLKIDFVNGVWGLGTPLKSGVLFGRSGESQQAIQNGGNMLASVAFVSSDTFGGIFPYLILSVGVFISFYIIQQLVMFLGREKIKKKK
jgi:hypothetical protein